MQNEDLLSYVDEVINPILNNVSFYQSFILRDKPNPVRLQNWIKYLNNALNQLERVKNSLLDSFMFHSAHHIAAGAFDQEQMLALGLEIKGSINLNVFEPTLKNIANTIIAVRNQQKVLENLNV